MLNLENFWELFREHVKLSIPAAVLFVAFVICLVIALNTPSCLNDTSCLNKTNTQSNPGCQYSDLNNSGLACFWISIICLITSTVLFFYLLNRAKNGGF